MPGPTHPPSSSPGNCWGGDGEGGSMRAAGGQRNTLQASLGSSCSVRKLHVGSTLDTDLEGKKQGFFTQNPLGAL